MNETGQCTSEGQVWTEWGAILATIAALQLRHWWSNTVMWWQAQDEISYSVLDIGAVVDTVDWQALSCSSPVLLRMKAIIRCFTAEWVFHSCQLTFLCTVDISDWNGWGVWLLCSTRIWEFWPQWELAMTTVAFHQSGWLNMFSFVMMSQATPTGV